MKTENPTYENRSIPETRRGTCASSAYEGDHSWFEKEKQEDSYADYVTHIEESRRYKNGAGVEQPYDTHTLHVWGEANIDSWATPTHDEPFHPLGWIGGSAEWDDEDRTYFDGEEELGYLKTWDLSWNNGSLDQPPAQPQTEGTGAARGTGKITGGPVFEDFGRFGAPLMQRMGDVSFDDLSRIPNANEDPLYDKSFGMAMREGQVSREQVRGMVDSLLPSLPSLDEVQGSLDLAGFAEGPIGLAADLANSAISFGRGDFMGGAINLGAAIPGFGLPFNAAKAAKKVDNVVEFAAPVVSRVKDLAGVGLKAIEMHHLLPKAKEFAHHWKRAGLNSEDFKIPLPKDIHRLKPDGIHTGPENWNKQWRDFFNKTPNARREEILDQLGKMREQFGI